ncbi:hypothetical protein JGH11_16075 [Dysgonomonas sp. Marseille-P4677]|uniref:MFS transporter n=1 Tax=Dysgonomonas sp. Marseille-P4677 TaxID=2364790 RepID=UPI0019126C9E|nr:MFS transporter [Dysgonomonas sp. Marseille-P4677]MBK5722394.1 hypothetical protein [Dysgonomonas sp. Marseille-P4677]
MKKVRKTADGYYIFSQSILVGSDAAGLLSIVGIGGAVSATYVSRIVDIIDKRKILFASSILMLLAWLLFYSTGLMYIGLIFGIFILDIGLQSIHITNQSIIFSKDEDATNRLNTAYMTCYFLGGSLGAFLGGKAWAIWGWDGVVITGIVFILFLLVLQFFPLKSLNK